MAELDDAVNERIQALCAEGDTLAKKAKYPAALEKYWAAWDLLPQPQTDWEAAKWILAAIGDANFLGGDFVAGRDNLSMAMHCPEAIGSPFLHLRLGQCHFELGNLDRAADELARAYMGAGEEIFEGAGKYFEFVKTGGLVLVATRRGDAVIELVPTEHDDVAFVSLAQRIMNGAIAELRMREAFVVHVDNWFDHKWLGWWSRKDEELRVPTFTPNRVFSEKHFVWKAETSVWDSVELQRPLHVRQPGRPWLAQPIDRFSESAAFIWYSGNTATNKVGSLMLYLSGAEGYSWYASFRKGEDWTVADECRITRRELSVFEERGRQLELAQT